MNSKQQINEIISLNSDGIYERDMDSGFINPHKDQHDVELKYIMNALEGSELCKEEFWLDGENSFYTDEYVKCICNKRIRKVNVIVNKSSGRQYVIGSTCVERLNKSLGELMKKKFNKLDKLKKNNLKIFDDKIEHLKNRISNDSIYVNYNMNMERLLSNRVEYQNKIDKYISQQYKALLDSKVKYPEVKAFHKSSFTDAEKFIEQYNEDNFKQTILSCKCKTNNRPLKPSYTKKEGDNFKRVFFTCRNKRWNPRTKKDEGVFCDVFKFGYFLEEDDYAKMITDVNPMLYYVKLYEENETRIDDLELTYKEEMQSKNMRDSLDKEEIIELEKKREHANHYIIV